MIIIKSYGVFVDMTADDVYMFSAVTSAETAL